MRNLLYLTIMVFCLSNAAAQTYLENNPRWTFNRSCNFEPPCQEQLQYHHYTNGDTLINGFQYKRIETELKKEWYWMSSATQTRDCNGFDFSKQPTHFLRQEGKKLFAYSSGKDTLLYDFDITIGSRVPLSLYNSDSEIEVVGENFIKIENIERRVILLQGNSYSATLIEGIGHTRGLFQEIYNTVDCTNHIDCYSVGGKRYIKEGSFVESVGSCLSSMGLSQIITDYAYSVSFDQDSKTIKVKFSQSIQQDKLTITNLLGQKIFTNQEVILQGTELAIPLNQSTNGIIVLSAEVNNTIRCSKIFVRD